MSYQRLGSSSQSIPSNTLMSDDSDVIFSEISEIYRTDSTIKCKFNIGSSVKQSPSDKICLYKVPLKEANEMLLTKEISQCDANDDDFGTKVITFHANELPKDRSEHYQLAYVDESNAIRGISIAFRFCGASDNDLIQFEERINNNDSDNEEFVVVRTQQVLLHERVQQLANANGVLEYSNRTLQQQLANSETQLNELKNEITKRDEHINDVNQKYQIMEQKYAEMEMEMNRVMNKCRESEALCDSLNAKLAMNDAQLELSRANVAQVMSERRDLESENKVLKDEIKDFIAKCESYEINKQMMINEMLELEKCKLKTKVEMKVVMENANHLRQKLDDTEMGIEERNSKERQLQHNLNEMRNRLAGAATEYETLFKENNKLQNKLQHIRDKIKKVNDEKSVKQQPNGVMIRSVIPKCESLKHVETEVKKVMESQLTAGLEEHNSESIKVITIPCSICSDGIMICDGDLKPMALHLEEKHCQRLCPICSMLFDFSISGAERYFQWHIEDHFKNEN